MESSKSATVGSGMTAGSRSKLSPSTRFQRNLAEKERRDKLNGFISELAGLIPMVSNASKPLDKVSILRLAAAEMRLHFSCLNPKKYKKKPLILPPSVMASLDLIEKATGGFVLVTTLTGLIIFCSKSIEDYLGYQNIDVMGNNATKYIYEDDVKFFEVKVNSVVNSFKKANKKKTKVIKAHMLQKPLPRSHEVPRPRKMILKISVHQNDTSENGGNSGSGNLSSNTRKTRPPKDFGYSAVVLLFIEPVRFEPEVDMVYIDSNQDVYFTRHGLQGEIIYADQRISTITGYMPHEVLGKSAYQYICSSDVPIALFAQKAMFTSLDGKGVIVYRLRITDMRCIYLQSSGQTAYKESSKEISHFVCFNRLLGEEEGSQELRKFQQRYAPQIMAAKLLQVKQGIGNKSPTTDLAFERVMSLVKSSPASDSPSTSAQTTSFLRTEMSTSSASPTTDLAFERVMSLMKSSPASDSPSTSAQITSFLRTEMSTSNACSGIVEQKSNETVVSPSSFSTGPNFIQSSENLSASSSINGDQSSSITLNCNPAYFNDTDIDIILERPEQRLGGGPLRRTESTTLSSNPYKIVTNDRKEKGLVAAEFKHPVNEFHPTKLSHCVNNQNSNKSYHIHQNSQYIDINRQNKNVHFVNVDNNLLNGSDLAQNNNSMDFDQTHPQKISLQFTSSEPYIRGQSNDQTTNVNHMLSEYLKFSEQNAQNKGQLSVSFDDAPNIVCDQLNFDEVEILGSQLSHAESMSSLSGMADTHSVSSLLPSSNLSVLSDNYIDFDYCHNYNSYPESDSFLNSISSFNSGANTSTNNNLDNLIPKTFSVNETGGFIEATTSVDESRTISPMETFDSIKTSVEMTAVLDPTQKTLQNGVYSMDNNIYETENGNTITVNHNGSLNMHSAYDGQENSALIDWTKILLDPAESEYTSLQIELYRELNVFFQNIQQLNPSVTSVDSKGISSSQHHII